MGLTLRKTFRKNARLHFQGTHTASFAARALSILLLRALRRVFRSVRHLFCVAMARETLLRRGICSVLYLLSAESSPWCPVESVRNLGGVSRPLEARRQPLFSLSRFPLSRRSSRRIYRGRDRLRPIAIVRLSRSLLGRVSHILCRI